MTTLLTMLVQHAPITPNGGASSTNARRLTTTVMTRPTLRKPGRPQAPRPVAAMSDGTHNTAEASNIKVGSVAARNSCPNSGPSHHGAVTPISAQPAALTNSVNRVVVVSFVASRSALFTPNRAPATASATISGTSEIVV